MIPLTLEVSEGREVVCPGLSQIVRPRYDEMIPVYQDGSVEHGPSVKGAEKHSWAHERKITSIARNSGSIPWQRASGGVANPEKSSYESITYNGSGGDARINFPHRI